MSVRTEQAKADERVFLAHSYALLSPVDERKLEPIARAALCQVRLARSYEGAACAAAALHMARGKRPVARGQATRILKRANRYWIRAVQVLIGGPP